MPKVNTDFFECPKCHSLEFEVTTKVVFCKDIDGGIGVVYRTIRRIVCPFCHTVVKEEIIDG